MHTAEKGFTLLVILIGVSVVIGSVALGYYFLLSKTGSSTILRNLPIIQQGKLEEVLGNSEFNYKSQVLVTLPDAGDRYKYDNCQFSPSGYKVACIKSYNINGAYRKASVVVNDKEGKLYNRIADLQFSPDSKSVAYIADNGADLTVDHQTNFVVLNNQEGPEYESISHLTFSPDGQHIAYCVGKGRYILKSPYSSETTYRSAAVVVDNVESGSYDGIIPDRLDSNRCIPVFSPDSQHVAHYETIQKDNQLIIDSNAVLHSDLALSIPIFSQNGTKILLVPNEPSERGPVGNPELVDLSGRIITKFNHNAYDNIEKLSVNKDGSKVMSVGLSIDGAGPLFINDNQAVSARNLWVTNLSPNGNQLAYSFTTDAPGGVLMVGDPSTSPTAHIIINNQEVGSFRTFNTRFSHFVFSPDGKDTAYLLGSSDYKTQGRLMIVEGPKVCTIAFPGYPTFSRHRVSTAELSDPAFSPDGKYIGFGNISDNILSWKVGKINMDKCSLD